MRQKIITLLKDVFIQKLGKVFAVSTIIYLLVGVWKWKQLPPQLPLFYSLPKGPDQLGTPFLLLFLPVLSVLLFMINLVIASFLYSNEKLAAYIITVISVVISILFLIAFIKIVFLIS